MGPERYQQLLEAVEEAEDIDVFDAAVTEEGDNIPWDQVRADLGWSWAGIGSRSPGPLPADACGW